MNYVIGDCALGEDLRLDIPSDIEVGELTNEDGELFNTTSQTITVYCDQFPQYSFRLQPFSGLSYRSDNYTYSQIPFTIDHGPYLALPIRSILLFGVLLISALMIICKGGVKRA